MSYESLKEESERSRLMAEEIGLPALEGTERQNQWAYTIRDTFYRTLGAFIFQFRDYPNSEIAGIAFNATEGQFLNLSFAGILADALQEMTIDDTISLTGKSRDHAVDVLRASMKALSTWINSRLWIEHRSTPISGLPSIVATIEAEREEAYATELKNEEIWLNKLNFGKRIRALFPELSFRVSTWGDNWNNERRIYLDLGAETIVYYHNGSPLYPPRHLPTLSETVNKNQETKIALTNILSDICERFKSTTFTSKELSV